MSLSFTVATEAEVAAVIGIAPAGDERRAAIAAHIAARECHVAWQDGAAVGYLVLTRTFFHSPFIELVVVSPDARRTGIGRALLEHCIGLIPTGEKLWTSTNDSNTPMRALLPKAGFVESGRVDNLDPGDPELIFVRLP